MISLKNKAKVLPSSPGVYLMKGASDHIIYVGKSKNLKARVGSYFMDSKNHSSKIVKLVKQIKDFDYILTDTEFEAFLLENYLIKDLKPHFNKLMKNPKAYTYIEIGMNQELPTIKMTYDKNRDSNQYFGPFTSKSTVEKAINGLKDFYKLNCNHPTKRNSPCLNYSLGMCMGICFDASKYQQYQQVIHNIIALFREENSVILEEMELAMIDASSNFDFEKAAKIRDSINAIQSLLNKEKAIEFAKENHFIVVIDFIDDEQRKLFLIHQNKVIFKQIYDISGLNLIKAELKSYINFTVPLINISKEEIDEVQIIYRYLKSNACEYLIIPEAWLDNSNKINSAIEEFFATNFVQKCLT